VAKEFVKAFKVTLPVFVDSMDDKVGLAYSGWPDRIYVIDREGKIAYKGDPGPRGFRPVDVPPIIDRLLKADRDAPGKSGSSSP
jgi:Iodothyronine deiodinase